MKNSDLYLIALYNILGNMWENYTLPKHLEKLWNKVDTLTNEKYTTNQMVNFINDNTNDYLKAVNLLETVYNM